MDINSKIKVILADRDRLFQENMKSYLEQRGTVEVIGMADSGSGVLELAKARKADVLIMDVLLGECDGLWVLESMQKLETSPDVTIMVSVVDSDKVVRKAMSLGADYYMAKPIQGSILLDRVEQLYYARAGVEYEPTRNAEPIRSRMSLDEPAEMVSSLEADISVVLSRMGVPASIKGYHYIRKAIMMAVENEESLIGITKGLYPDIAKHYKTSASKVERAIRHAIESSWKRNGKNIFIQCSGYHAESKPTNGQFIAAISEYFRLNTRGRSKRSAS